MIKAKNILITVILLIIIGVGLYSVRTLIFKPPAKELLSGVAGSLQEFQGMKYRIIGVEVTKDKIKKVVCDVITGEMTEGEVKLLTERIVED